ncbi:MAG: hypothetical protein CVU71_07220 [Deltaproteobacteria bacterium HGW-Deltaproteobacteria-6]|jgi:S-adenosylmethionine synthetase|nr:MAG: hypothetical protein CVU71_07220 [Deltaproteobacteria bacterium HGW-Deltaproteobacteria-6]
MIRVSEIVFPGHPDKVCDIITDAIVAEASLVDPDAYVQVEAGIWCDTIWLSGSVAASVPLERQIDDIVRDALRNIGLRGGNTVAADDYTISCNVGVTCEDPREWTRHVNDQAVVIGWAGYDAKIRFLPPEHFLIHALREGIVKSLKEGDLKGKGPDGKLLVRVREEGNLWHLEHIIATMQQRKSTSFIDFCGTLHSEIDRIYMRLQEDDHRWVTPVDDIEVMINPNGPFIEGCSLGDNGQTGRKLVMDFYGPRVPIGGGALSGKHLSHIDRVGAYVTRQAAVEAVCSGARECKITAVYAPNVDAPLEVIYEMDGRGSRLPNDWFQHKSIMARFDGLVIPPEIGEGTHFWNTEYVWNSRL